MIFNRIYGTVVLSFTAAGLTGCVAMPEDAAEDPSAEAPASPEPGATAAREGVDTSDGAEASPLPNDHPTVFHAQTSRIFTAAAAAELELAYRIGHHRVTRFQKVSASVLSGDPTTPAPGSSTPGSPTPGSPTPDSPTPDLPELEAPDWNVHTKAPVVAAAAVWGPSFYAESDTDQMFFGTNSSTTPGLVSNSDIVGCTAALCDTSNFFAVTKIYPLIGSMNAQPTLSWAKNIPGGITANVMLNFNGSKVFAYSRSRVLYCYNASDGSTCATWSNYTVPTGNANTSTPWISHSSNAIFINDGAGKLYKLNATTGALLWNYTFSASGSSASPVELEGILYVGDGAGKLWRIADPGVTAPTVSASVTLTAANCTSPAAVDGSVSIDGTVSTVFLPNQGCMFTFPHYATTGTWAIKASGWTGSVPNKTFQTWAALDGTYVYWVIPDYPTSSTANSAVWKAPYALTSVSSSLLKNPGAVSATPLIWNGSVYAGDQAGYVERFGCASSSNSTTSFASMTTSVVNSVQTDAAAGAYGTTILSPVVLNNSAGDINFGYANGTAGGMIQYPQNVGSASDSVLQWACPAGLIPCDNQTCGVGAHSTKCVAPSACVPSTYTCSTVPTVGCVNVSEGSSISSSTVCNGQRRIRAVLGATYGSPVSACGATTTLSMGSSCYAAESLSVTQASCPSGGTACNSGFNASNASFGDPCVGTGKSYTAYFACDSTAGNVYCSRQNVVPAVGSDPCNTITGKCAATCATGWGDCNSNLQSDGCETYIKGADRANCGACGATCASTQSCVLGVCQ
jgi:hypothetical protein